MRRPLILFLALATLAALAPAAAATELGAGKKVQEGRPIYRTTVEPAGDLCSQLHTDHVPGYPKAAAVGRKVARLRLVSHYDRKPRVRLRVAGRRGGEFKRVKLRVRKLGGDRWASIGRRPFRGHLYMRFEASARSAAPECEGLFENELETFHLKSPRD